MDKAIIDIYYCRQCNWMLRSTWLSQELLHTFSEEIDTISLHPDTGVDSRFSAMASKFGNVRRTAVFLRQKY